MSARIMPLRLEAFEQLPKHARRCVFWEVDPGTLGKDEHLADPEFEKEAWLSMVMLEWGSCGQVATAVPDERSQAEPPCLGYVFYAAVMGIIMPGIDNWAHAGGFAGGYLVSMWLDPLKPERTDHMVIAAVCLAASALAVLASIATALWPFIMQLFGAPRAIVG